MSMTPTLNRGLQRYIADSNSALLGLQPEDWLDMEALWFFLWQSFLLALQPPQA